MKTLAASSSLFVPRLRHLSWHFPEWWVLIICAAAWATLISGVGHRHDMAHVQTPGQQLFAWTVMVAAMMLPLVVSQIRWLAQGSFWNRRHRAVAGFVAGYMLPWCAVGVAASVLLSFRWMHTAMVPVGLFLLAAVWQRTLAYRFARRACHRTMPLAPLGWRADGDCLRYGSLVGTACVRSCLPLMLACAATGHGLVAMAGGCLLGLLEAWSPMPSSRIPAVGTVALAAYYALFWAPNATTSHPPMHM